MGGQVSAAVDVYSYRVILFEIFIQRSPTDDMFKDGMTIAKLTEINFPDNVLLIVDPQLLQELEQREDFTMTIRDSGEQTLQSVLSIGTPKQATPRTQQRSGVQGVQGD